MKSTATSRWRVFKPAKIKTTRLVIKSGVLGLLVFGADARAQGLPAGVRQLIVSVAPSWESTRGRLQCFEREGAGWRPVAGPFAVLYGRNGLAWGRGVLGAQEPGRSKVERDGRSPAGVFALGTIYTYDRQLPPGADYPFHTVTAADAWVDDVQSPHYNRHVRIPDPGQAPAWFEKQRMRLHDFAYRWLVEIRHNSDPPAPGAGSAIFFHIRRGPDKPSAGCTTLAEADLVSLIRWLRPEKMPHYVLLPRDQYAEKWQAWGLPGPMVAAGLAP